MRLDREPDDKELCNRLGVCRGGTGDGERPGVTPGGFDLGSERSHNLTFASCVHEPHVDQIPGASVRRFDSYLIRGWFAPGSGIRPCADRGHYPVAGVEGVPADISVFICRCHHGMRGCTGYGFVRGIGGGELKLVVRGSRHRIPGDCDVVKSRCATTREQSNVLYSGSWFICLDARCLVKVGPAPGERLGGTPFSPRAIRADRAHMPVVCLGRVAERRYVGRAVDRSRLGDSDRIGRQARICHRDELVIEGDLDLVVRSLCDRIPREQRLIHGGSGRRRQ